MGSRRIGGGARSTACRRREHPRCSGNRGSHDIGIDVRDQRARRSCSAMLDDQQDVIAFLSEPSSYGVAVDKVDVIETHVSLVFLAGDHAYKPKRPIESPYLDFSPPEHRRRACEAELALNRRTAPTLYLEVRALGRMPDGKIGFAGNGPAIDWLVVMRRFEQSSLFDALAQTGGLSAPLMHELAGYIVDFHAM